MKPNWTILPTVPASTVGEIGLPQAHCQLLYNRGLTDRSTVQAFLSPGSSDSHDPWLMPDMEAAVDRLIMAMDCGETIGVFGDFDIDGISGTAVMSTALRDLGADVISYIPDRVTEGHGLGLEAVQSLERRGVKLLITVDCGSSSEDVISEATALGVDTIVTDHHVLLDDPPYPVVAMVNPRRPDSEYPFEHLTGSGTAYKVAQGLYHARDRQEPPALLSLAALGTVGDVGPLLGENRYIVTEGLRQMNASRSVGLQALSAVSRLGNQDLDTGSLSFQIIPRLNAPGRLADPGISLNLLTTSDPAQARSIASQIDKLNSVRRSATEKGVKQAEDQIHERWGGDVPGIIMVGRTDWRDGIVGLIASRIAEAYSRPAIAVAVGDQLSRASARSIDGFNLMEVIEPAGHLMTQFGGHEQAAGFSIPNENLGELAQHLESIAVLTKGQPGEPRIEIDMICDPSTLERDLFEFIETLAPFGKSNPRPKFVATALMVVDSRLVGSGSHLKLSVADDRKTWDAIAFRMGERISEASAGTSIDVVYEMETNVWHGRKSLQLVIEDFAPTGQQQPRLI